MTLTPSPRQPSSQRRDTYDLNAVQEIHKHWIQLHKAPDGSYDFQYLIQTFSQRYHSAPTSNKPPIIVFDYWQIPEDVRDELSNSNKAEEIIQDITRACQHLLVSISPIDGPEVVKKVRIEFSGWPRSFRITKEDAGKLVHLEGRNNDIDLPQILLRSYSYECLNCRALLQDREQPIINLKCPECNERQLRDISSSRPENTVDQCYLQLLLLQPENYGDTKTKQEETTGGSVLNDKLVIGKRYVWLDVLGDLANKDNMLLEGYGKNLSVHGVVKLAEAQNKQIIKGRKNLFPYVEVNSIELVEDSRIKDYNQIEVTSEDIEYFKSFFKQAGSEEHALQLISQYLAGHLIGNEEINFATLCQMVGGMYQLRGRNADSWSATNKNKLSGNTGAAAAQANTTTQISYDEERKTINIEDVGPPGCGKTALALRMAYFSCGIYDTADNLSTVGLGAGISVDKVTGRNTIDTGILVHADGRSLSLDEMDSKKADDPSFWKTLSTAMQQGVVSVNKIRKGLYQAKGPKRLILNPNTPDQQVTIPLRECISVPQNVQDRCDLIIARTNIVLKGDDKGIIAELAQKEKLRSMTRKTFGLGVNESLIDPITKQPDNLGSNKLLQECVKLGWNDDRMFKYIKYCQQIEPFTRTNPVELESFYLKLGQVAEERDMASMISNRTWISMLLFVFARAQLCMRTTVTSEDELAIIRLFTHFYRLQGLPVELSLVNTQEAAAAAGGNSSKVQQILIATPESPQQPANNNLAKKGFAVKEKAIVNILRQLLADRAVNEVAEFKEITDKMVELHYAEDLYQAREILTEVLRNTTEIKTCNYDGRPGYTHRW